MTELTKFKSLAFLQDLPEESVQARTKSVGGTLPLHSLCKDMLPRQCPEETLGKRGVIP